MSTAKTFAKSMCSSVGKIDIFYKDKGRKLETLIGRLCAIKTVCYDEPALLNWPIMEDGDEPDTIITKGLVNTGNMIKGREAADLLKKYLGSSE